MKKYLPHITLLLILCACSASRKVTALWVSANPSDQADAPEVLPSDFALYKLDITLLTKSLKEIGSDQDQGLFVQFPNPEGDMNSFKIWRSSVVSEGLLEKYPNLRAYQGFNISDDSDIRMELPNQGLQVMVRSVGRTWFIAPYDKEQQLYMVFYKADFPSDNKFWEGRIK